MGVVFKTKGDWNDTFSFLRRDRDSDFIRILKKYGEKGVRALSEATPKDTGTTANSWEYEIITTENGFQLSFNNTNMASNGTPIVVLLQYGHGKRNGGYVKGIDFMNPVLKPLFEKLSTDLWNEVNQ
jgi:hypothetical protein